MDLQRASAAAFQIALAACYGGWRKADGRGGPGTGRSMVAADAPASHGGPAGSGLGSELFPQAPWLAPSAPPAFVASPNAARAAAAWREVGVDTARPEPASDPTWDQVQARTLATPAELRQKPAPFVRLAIPDPFENITAVRLEHPPPDADPPAASLDLPSRPPLPIAPPKPAEPKR